ncbi:hypothetical protein LZ32DRAFT_653265 [Colletotrichum eremochloae]|uniref:Uncharacterized protein n=1 Tax=Colletotrichum sublineola TaxID=1173701 RepID=A0A066XSZ6_COLSU|nr:hypothetical protein LY78DRAFT_686474 [Colletotrichum sublineola]KAK2019094.1 hypothetical protein LZ32DRAFT_653265 [Colletotrichum eremochloae]KDN70814.1 hypothetical protein CSUB01_11166 [Colletotrichum sublineola]
MHLRSFLFAGLAAAGGVHSLRLGLPGVALGMTFTLGRATLAVSDVTADDGLERRQGEENVCMSIDPSECTVAKRDGEKTDDDLELAGFVGDDEDD